MNILMPRAFAGTDAAFGAGAALFAARVLLALFFAGAGFVADG
jgi:hypothetical protein